MSGGAHLRIWAAASWTAAARAAGSLAVVASCSSLNAPQKPMAAPPAESAAGGAFVAATVAGAGADVGFAAVGDVDFVELATLLDPDEHPASAATRTKIRDSRRIVIRPRPWVGYVFAR